MYSSPKEATFLPVAEVHIFLGSALSVSPVIFFEGRYASMARFSLSSDHSCIGVETGDDAEPRTSHCPHGPHGRDTRLRKAGRSVMF